MAAKPRSAKSIPVNGQKINSAALDSYPYTLQDLKETAMGIPYNEPIGSNSHTHFCQPNLANLFDLKYIN